MVHKPQIELLDVVALTAEVGSLATGSLGTVVEWLSDDAFEVEFINDQGYTLAILTLRRDCLRKVLELEAGGRREVMHRSKR
jgi:hypothetical protein